MEENENEKKKMSLKEYIIRLLIWATVLLVPPLIYLEVNYGLFTNKTGLALSGWGVVGVTFGVIMLLYVLNQIKNGLNNGSMFRQCVEGYIRLLPMIAIIVIIHYVKTAMDKMEGFLVIVALCQIIAVPINPNPKWSEQNGTTTIMDCLRTIFHKVSDKKD